MSLKLLAIDRMTWNSFKAELIAMWKIATDYEKVYQQ